MTDFEFVKALQSALAKDIENEYNTGYSEAGLYVHSAKYRRFEKRILKDPMGYVNRASQKMWKCVMYRAAMVIIVIAVFFGLMMTIPPVRAFVFSVIEEFDGYNKHITDVNRNEGVASKYSFGYLPDGYAVVSENETGQIVCSDGETQIILVYNNAHNSMWVSVDRENMVDRNIMIGDYRSTLYVSNTDDKLNYIIWYDETEKVYFAIFSTIEVDELIKVAEGIKIE